MLRDFILDESGGATDKQTNIASCLKLKTRCVFRWKNVQVNKIYAAITFSFLRHIDKIELVQ